MGLDDIAIALASGSAGVLAFTTRASSILIGVMVAVALLPPLVAFGLLLGAGHELLAFGALLLLFVNIICINLAGVVTFLYHTFFTNLFIFLKFKFYSIMPIRIKLIALSGLLMPPIARSAQDLSGVDTSGTVVQLISFLLAMCGSTYLAAALWRKGEGGSESWRYISVSMIMLALWNVIMAFGIMLTTLQSKGNLNSMKIIDNTNAIVKVLDPVIAVIAFLILLFGLEKIIKAMRDKPWTVFSEERPDE